jgi:hypothetical protein
MFHFSKSLLSPTLPAAFYARFATRLGEAWHRRIRDGAIHRPESSARSAIAPYQRGLKYADEDLDYCTPAFPITKDDRA